MNKRPLKVMAGVVFLLSITFALSLGALRTIYDKEYTTIEANLPEPHLETLKLNLADQGIFKKIFQPHKLYLRIRYLHNTSDQTMRLKFNLTDNQETATATFKINSKRFDIQKETIDIAPGEEASLNLYLDISDASYEKGGWNGQLAIKDVHKDNLLIGQIPIEIINTRRL